MAYFDFGFIEPGVLAEEISGKLAVRVVMGELAKAAKRAPEGK